MKIRVFIFCLSLFFTVSAYTQVEGRRDSIVIDMDNKLPDSYKTIEVESGWEAESREKVSVEEMEEIKKREEFIKTLKFRTLPLYVGPMDEGEKLGRIMPHTYDYAFYQSIPVNSNTTLITSSTRNTYMLIGATRQISASLAHSLTDWLTVSGGGYTAKYNLNGQQFDDMGFNASVRVQLHERIAIRAHGLYSINSFDRNRNFTPVTAGLYPQTYYGGGLEFKITEKFGVEGGMVRELNPFNGKWVNRPYIMPIVYSTKGGGIGISTGR